jgi:hypothetical protein
MIDMSKNIELYVCRPDVGITKSLEVVFVQFELMDKGTLEGTGKPHAVAMTTEDAMQLLRNLQYLQKQFDLTPAEDDPIEMKGGPGQAN